MQLRFASRLKTIVLGFTITTALGLSSQANAGLLLEPYVGYQGSVLQLSKKDGVEPKIQMKGTTYGARLGFTIPLFFAALDYSSMNGTADGWGYNNNSLIQNQIAAVIGMQIPFFRFFVGYGFSNDLKIQDTTDDTFSGSAIKAGASFTAIPFVSLNLEYIMNSYNKWKTPGVDQSIPGEVFSKAGNDSIFFSLSLPFDI